MAQTWVVVADEARARFFERNRDGSLREFDDLVSPELRLHEAELTSDRPGRTFNSPRAGSHALHARHSARDQEIAVFAKKLAEHIDDARVAGYLDKLVLIAPPRFLGELRARLNSQVRELIVHSIDKELTTASTEELAARLPRAL
jgi:protein required for attachment to host cells